MEQAFAHQFTIRDRRKPSKGVLIWLDYFSLRQCRNDFKLDAVIELVRRMPSVYCIGDPENVYMGRSFCLLELYAGVISQQSKVELQQSLGDEEALVRHGIVKQRELVIINDSIGWLLPVPFALGVSFTDLKTHERKLIVVDNVDGPKVNGPKHDQSENGKNLIACMDALADFAGKSGLVNSRGACEARRAMSPHFRRRELSFDFGPPFNL